MRTTILATIDDLNQYLQDNIPSQALINTLEKLIKKLKNSKGISENTTMENLNEGKKGKSSYMTELAEIDRQSALVALEAKINKLAEMAEAKTNRLSMVHEDENLSELISKQAVKEMQRSIKEIEKLKEKLLKEFTKKGGKMTEVIDEEMGDNTSDKINPANTDKQNKDREKYLEKGAMPPHMIKKEEVEEEMKDKEVEEGYSSTYEEDNIDEASCGTYEEDGDGSVKEETNEEVNRWQELAGL